MSKRDRQPVQFSVRLLDAIAREVRLEHSFVLVTRETSYVYNPTSKRFTEFQLDKSAPALPVTTVIYEGVYLDKSSSSEVEHPEV